MIDQHDPAQAAEFADTGLTEVHADPLGLADHAADLVGQAVSETTIDLLRGSDAPVDLQRQLLPAITGPAVRAVLLARMEQLTKHGHSADGDWSLPLTWLPKEARDRLAMAHDNLSGPHKNFVVARRRLAAAAALLLAAIDRLDMEAQDNAMTGVRA